jgi:hypothetical protein
MAQALHARVPALLERDGLQHALNPRLRLFRRNVFGLHRRGRCLRSANQDGRPLTPLGNRDAIGIINQKNFPALPCFKSAP